MAVRLEGIFIVRIVGGEQNWVILAPAELQNSHRFLGNLQEQVLHPGILLVTGSRTTSRGSNRAPHQTPTMPRLRGTPRRGAAWYAAKSRRQRKQTFEAALAIARRRRKASHIRHPWRMWSKRFLRGVYQTAYQSTYCSLCPRIGTRRRTLVRVDRPRRLAKRQLPKATTPKGPNSPVI
jgi:hypothetical protein